jgi:hypothetical protein
MSRIGRGSEVNQRRAALLAALAAALPVIAGQVHGWLLTALAFTIGVVAALSLPSMQAGKKALDEGDVVPAALKKSLPMLLPELSLIRCEYPYVRPMAWRLGEMQHVGTQASSHVRDTGAWRIVVASQ